MARKGYDFQLHAVRQKELRTEHSQVATAYAEEVAKLKT